MTNQEFLVLADKASCLGEVYNRLMKGISAAIKAEPSIKSIITDAMLEGEIEYGKAVL